MLEKVAISDALPPESARPTNCPQL